MSRAILAASRIHPVWQSGAARVEAPDEDAFTLSVGAVDLLAPQFRPEGHRRLRRLHLIGAYGPEVDWAFAEALGIPHLEIRRHPPTAQGLWGALAAAAHEDGLTGREAVVTAETTFPTPAGKNLHGAGAAAFLLGSEEGLTPVRHGFRASTPGRAPSMKGTILGWLESVGASPSDPPLEVVFETDELGTRWQSAWEEAAPGASVIGPVPGGEPTGGTTALRAANTVWELARRLRTRQAGLIAEVREGRSGYAGFRLDGPVQWRGQWGPLPAGAPPKSVTFLDRRPDVTTVSQGAYVPHLRYLENLPSRWRLEGERCGHCRALTFPVAGRCGGCGRSDGLRREALSREGLEVEAVTSIGPGAQPTEFDPVVAAAGPYDVAILRLAPGVRGTFQVTDATPGEVGIGQRVRLTLRRLYPMEGEWRYGLKAVPERGARATPPARSRPFSPAPTARPASPRGPAAATGTRRRAAR